MDAQHFLPAAGSQQAAQLVPSAVFGIFGQQTKHLDQLIHLAATLAPVLGKGGHCHCGGVFSAGTPVLVINDEVQMKQDAQQDRVAELRLVLAKALQVECVEGPGQRLGDGLGRPLPVGRLGGQAGKQFFAQGIQRLQARLKRALRVGQATEPEWAGQLVQGGQPMLARFKE